MADKPMLNSAEVLRLIQPRWIWPIVRVSACLSRGDRNTGPGCCGWTRQYFLKEKLELCARLKNGSLKKKPANHMMAHQSPGCYNKRLLKWNGNRPQYNMIHICSISVRKCVFSLRGEDGGNYSQRFLDLVGKATEGRQRITEVWFPC